MKEFNKSETVTYNLMSFTAFKSLFIFSLLLKGPQSYADIQEHFKNHKFLREEISVDAIRVYLTSLKRAGCTIERLKKSEGGKYKLTSHPFQLKITEEQVKGLIKIYKIILKSADVSDLLGYENFIGNLAIFTKNNDLKLALEKVSIIKNIDKNILKDLIKYSNQNLKMTILYNSPRTEKREIEVVANSVSLASGKIYLSGISLDYNKETSYLVERIIKIIDVDLEHKPNIKLQPITVGYELSTKNSNVKLCEYENIVEIKEDSVVVEATSTNSFALKRKILEYGPSCTVLYPKDFREDIINTLKTMKAGYRNA